MDNLRYKIISFMQGRYGVDDFSKFLLGFSIALMIVNMFFNSLLLNLIGMIAIIYCYYRIFSRNISKMYNQNQKFLQKTVKIRRFFNNQIAHIKIRKTHHIYSCPQCRQKIRVPKGKGAIMVTCPKCRCEFKKVS